MRWKRTGRMSRNIDDRRGRSGGLRGGGLPMMGAGLGLPAIAIVLLMMFLNGGLGGGGGAVDDIFGGLQGSGSGGELTAEDQELAEFMGFVLDDAQAYWAEELPRQTGREYRDAKLVLFTGSTDSACGGATSQIGPHYCPVDENMYLDLDFFRELRDRFGAPGDFAQAYVLAHEIAHHVQNVVGTMDRIGRSNQESIRLELQADCYAGMWAETVAERGDLEAGDLEEGLTAAGAVGDDRIQEQAGQRVNPETWTHGSSEQRIRWFKTGFEGGDIEACDTFSAGSL